MKINNCKIYLRALFPTLISLNTRDRGRNLESFWGALLIIQFFFFFMLKDDCCTATVYFSVMVDRLGSRSHRLMGLYLYIRTARATSRMQPCRRVVAFDLFGTDRVEPRGFVPREDTPGSSRGRTFVHSWLRHRNNSTAIFLALCRVSVTNGSLVSRSSTKHTSGWRTEVNLRGYAVYFS